MYRYGFQGQEIDSEIKGKGNSLNYKYRMHDPRVGRFFAVDPLAAEYPHYTPYSFSGNKVIHAIELEGLEEFQLSFEISNVGEQIVRFFRSWIPHTYERAMDNPVSNTAGKVSHTWDVARSDKLSGHQKSRKAFQIWSISDESYHKLARHTESLQHSSGFRGNGGKLALNTAITVGALTYSASTFTGATIGEFAVSQFTLNESTSAIITGAVIETAVQSATILNSGDEFGLDKLDPFDIVSSSVLKGGLTIDYLKSYIDFDINTRSFIGKYDEGFVDFTMGVSSSFINNKSIKYFGEAFGAAKTIINKTIESIIGGVSGAIGNQIKKEIK